MQYASFLRRYGTTSQRTAGEHTIGGGSQHLAIIEFPGGNVSVQNFGPKYRDTVWEGWFEGPDAYERMIRIGNMRQKGEPFTLRAGKLNMKYVIADYNPDYKNDKYIPFSIRLRPLIAIESKKTDPIDLIFEKVKAEKKTEEQSVSPVSFPVPSGKRTPTDIIIRKSSGEVKRDYAGFTYEHPTYGLTEYGYKGADILKELGGEAKHRNNDSLFDVIFDATRRIIRVLVDGNYVEKNSILLKDLESMGIKVEFNNALRAAKKQVFIDAYMSIQIIILKKNGEINRSYDGFIYGNIAYVNNAGALLKELGYAPTFSASANTYSVTQNGGAVFFPVLKDGSYIKDDSIRLEDLSKLGIKVGSDTKKTVYSLNLGYTGEGSGDREIIIPQTVIGTLNGKPKTLYPKDNWGAPGKGNYPQGVQKENGRYKVAVGPKIVNANYPDSGRIWDNYDGLQKGIKLNAVLINKTKEETKIIECVVADYKAHSYNKYPDGHSYNTGDTASFNVENGIIQTGIAYPNSWNAGQPLACAPGNMDGIHVIEFCGHEVDFTVNDYRLEKVIIID